MKAGGIAALVQALCYLFGFAMLATVMNPGDTTGWSAVQKLAFILEREGLFQVWNIVIYVVFGIALVVLTAVLHRALDQRDSMLMSVATPFGFIWAGLVIASGMVASVGLTTVSGAYAAGPKDAAQLWATIGAVQDGLGGGVEIVGGVWVLLLSVASLNSGRVLSKTVNGIGMVVGLAGIATIVPAWSAFGAVFGLLQIFWFLAVGVVLLRGKGNLKVAMTRPTDSATDR